LYDSEFPPPVTSKIKNYEKFLYILNEQGHKSVKITLKSTLAPAVFSYYLHTLFFTHHLPLTFQPLNRVKTGTFFTVFDKKYDVFL